MGAYFTSEPLWLQPVSARQSLKKILLSPTFHVLIQAALG